MFQALNLVLLFFLNLSNLGPESLHDFLYVIPQRSRFNPLDTKVFYLFINNVVVSTGSDFLTCGWVNDVDLELRVNNFDHLSEYHTFLGPHLFLIFFYLDRLCLLLFLGACTSSGKPFRLYYDTFVSAGQFKRIIFDIFAGSAEYSMQ